MANDYFLRQLKIDEYTRVFDAIILKQSDKEPDETTHLIVRIKGISDYSKNPTIPIPYTINQEIQIYSLPQSAENRTVSPIGVLLHTLPVGIKIRFTGYPYKKSMALHLMSK